MQHRWVTMMSELAEARVSDNAARRPALCGIRQGPTSHPTLGARLDGASRVAVAVGPQ